MSLDMNKHLACVLMSHNIENDETLMTAYRKKRDEVRENLKEKYKGKIYRVIHSGSYKKFTAINLKFDMDVIIPFRKGEDTIKNLYDDLYAYFVDNYKKKDSSLKNVKKQKVAIGLEFNINGKILDLDIVPGREINDYEKDGELNLYVNEIMGQIAEGTYIKTNIQKQIDNVKENSIAREIIKLLKVWKRTNHGDIKSFVIELISIRALDGYKGDSNLWPKLNHVLQFIRDNITTVTLTDPGNSNNIISNSLSAFQKESIKSTMNWMVYAINQSSFTLSTYFPVNSEFPCDDGKRLAFPNAGAAYIVSDKKEPEKLNDDDFGSR